MILINKKGYKFNAQKCKPPKFKRGTWDFVRKIIRGKEVKFWLDFTWGWYFYFKYQEQWYRVRHHNRFSDEEISEDRFERFTIKAKVTMNRTGSVVIKRGERHKLYLNVTQSSRLRLKKLLHK